MPEQEGIKKLKLSYDPWRYDKAMPQAETATIDFLKQLSETERRAFIEKVSQAAGETAVQSQGEAQWRPVNL